ncbi:3-oxoacyl-ACP synthase III family protein [Endozoicomonas sp. G2_1]|uniref:3-oxoacyl-ACP synthase III family protein n=1 Tax=Endozoicomonas sp. G2_1 TaxID=2821091 RepID=UPI001ADB906A|nr:3-oxoacyl-ACP synthase III family protein [Endozoicomonas sp. G2_1]MBO9490794.1 3-oxoacyl-ACP synthase III family protein [Endozoicomonas sp. G2_1]
MTKPYQQQLDALADLPQATFATYSVKLVSASHVLPNNPINNHELIQALKQQTSSGLARKATIISKRLGIEQRYLSRSLTSAISQAQPSSTDIGYKAITQALSAANLTVDDIGYLIGHTTSPATLLPPNIAWVAEQLNYHAPYMELRQACTGFANSLQIASAMLSSQTCQHVAIMGSEVGSVYFDLSSEFIDTKQLVNFMQMGDGAGSVILKTVEPKDFDQSGVISDIYTGQIGVGKMPGFSMPQGGSNAVYCQQGLPYFDHQVINVRESGEQLFVMGLRAILTRGYQLDDFAYILPHQVNGHLDTLLSEQLGVPATRIINDAKHLGNLGSAAIWVSLDRLIKSERLSKGDKVLVLGAEATKYMYGGFVYQH